MLFNSYEFLFVFLPLVLVVYHRVLPRRAQTGFLTLASYAFYGWWDWRFCSLLLASTVVDYYAGRQLAATDDARSRRGWVALSLATNLGVLGFFKYAGFLAQSINAVAGGGTVPVFAVVLPVGISFYTFQSMSYTIDVYRRNVEPVRNFVDFACYVSLFSQLVAGPIVRFPHFRPQLESRTTPPDRFVDGLHLFVIGLAKKVLVADAAARVADPCFALPAPTFGLAWLGAAAFAIQIYFDFSGYSDMAVGLGRLFGFELPQNFNSPYRAYSMTDFWRRWHMSLSTWLRDYLYIPLGGNRRGRARTYVNLMATMLLGGLWHGANWTFVAWGAFHGVLLAVERACGIRGGGAPDSGPRGVWRVLRTGGTCVLLVFGWVLFRCQTIGQAAQWWTAMVGARGLRVGPLPVELEHFAVAVVPLAFAVCWFVPNTWEWQPPPTLRWAVAVSGLGVVAVIVILSSTVSPFLYFQF